MQLLRGPVTYPKQPKGILHSLAWSELVSAYKVDPNSSAASKASVFPVINSSHIWYYFDPLGQRGGVADTLIM
jgi:hypothetical protein